LEGGEEILDSVRKLFRQACGDGTFGTNTPIHLQVWHKVRAQEEVEANKLKIQAVKRTLLLY
jgi:hypothetical protein